MTIVVILFLYDEGMEKERIILHIDLNHCFAQIEEMKNPSLKEVPMCVGGDETRRSGIVLARNIKAKAYGVTSAETLYEARKKCPDLVVVPAHYEDYIYYTSKVKDIYKEYSDLVESYGLDEAWIDITNSYHLFGKPYDIPYEIQRRVLEEFNLTVSVGVSWNKIYAKLGSDLIKPSGMVIITRNNYERIVYTEPVESLLFVGQKTQVKLNDLGIQTIGDLAQANRSILEKVFGVRGYDLWSNARGENQEPVKQVGVVEDPKSISNSTTPPNDLHNIQEARIVLQHLCDSVASRMKDLDMSGSVISVIPRDTSLRSWTQQKKMSFHTDQSHEILKQVMTMLEESYDFLIPLRSIGVGVSGLKKNEKKSGQLSLEFGVKKQTEDALEEAISTIRDRFGYQAVKHASSLLDPDTVDFDAKKTNIVFPGRSQDFDLSQDIRQKILHKKDKMHPSTRLAYLQYKDS